MTSLITITGRVPNTIVAGRCLDFDAFTVVNRCQFLTGKVATHHPEVLHSRPFSLHWLPTCARFAQKAGASCLLSMQNPRTSSSLATNHKVYNLNRKWVIPPPLKNGPLLYTCSRALGNNMPVSSETQQANAQKGALFGCSIFTPTPKFLPPKERKETSQMNAECRNPCRASALGVGAAGRTAAASLLGLARPTRTRAGAVKSKTNTLKKKTAPRNKPELAQRKRPLLSL